MNTIQSLVQGDLSLRESAREDQRHSCKTIYLGVTTLDTSIDTSTRALRGVVSAEGIKLSSRKESRSDEHRSHWEAGGYEPVRHHKRGWENEERKSDIDCSD